MKNERIFGLAGLLHRIRPEIRAHRDVVAVMTLDGNVLKLAGILPVAAAARS
ncbi:MAG: hypothetical protein IT481_12445 [Gammaproteobacteria bacterium]|nr:hypothetical protein [Gammaproteobacteria bacterium]